MMNQQQLQQAAHRAIYEESTFDNPVDDERNTLLHIAVARGCIDTVRLLLSVGANASARNAHSKTPVDLAEEGGKQIILQIFNRWEFFRAVVSTGESSCDSSSQSKPPGSTVDLESLVPVEKMVVFNSSSVTTYEDYFDWTSSVRRFRLKKLLEKLKSDEYDDWLQLRHQQAALAQILLDLQALWQTLGVRQHQMSLEYWNEEQAVRKLRKSLVSITEFISTIRADLSNVANVTYWAGTVQVRLHKGLLLEVWRPYQLMITGSKIEIFHESGDSFRRRVIPMEDLVRVVVIKTGDADQLHRALLLEHRPRKKAPSRAADEARGQKLQTVHLRFPNTVRKGPQSRLPPADHLAYVLKLLNSQVEIRCEIDGSRRVEYELGGRMRSERCRDDSVVPERQRARRNTFDVSFSRLLPDDSSDTLDLSSFKVSRGVSMSLSAHSRSSRGRSMSMSHSSGVTSMESILSIDSILSHKKASRTSLQGIREGDCEHSRTHSRDDNEIVTRTTFLASPARYSLSSVPAELIASSGGSINNLLSTKRLLSGSIEDVQHLHDLRTALADSIEIREHIRKELEALLSTKESLREPLSFLRSLRNLVARPPMFAEVPQELRIEHLVSCLERFSKRLDESMRSEMSSLRHGNSFTGHFPSADTDEDPHATSAVVQWLAWGGSSANPNPPAQSASARQPDGWYGRSLSVCMGLYPSSSQKGWDSSLDDPQPSTTGEPGERPSNCRAPRSTAYRTMLGPPPALMRGEYDRVMNLLDDLCSCNHRAFEDAERLAQVLLLREDVWQRCQDLLDEPGQTRSIPVETDLVDIDF